MKVISVFSINKIGKIASLLVAVGILSLIICGIWNLFQDTLQVRANRSNAMQVAKQLVPEQIVPVMAPDFFSEYRLERDKIRSERSDLLREIIQNSTSTPETKQQAQDSILKMTLEKQREVEMENLIKAKGFADALVFIRENSVSAVVKTTTLTREEVEQVAEVISRVSGVKPGDITVSAKP